MSPDDAKNVQLLLIRFPLKFEPFKPLEGESNQLLVGIMDPSEQRTSTPMTAIHLIGNKKDIYNSIIERVKKINDLYYNNYGYINNPLQYNRDEKSILIERITNLGRDIKDLFTGLDINFDKWLERILIPKKKERISNQQLTIITNDFSIPWYWMKSSINSLFLCEACSVGMQQLEVDLSKKYDNMIDSFNVTIPNEERDNLLNFLRSKFRFIEDPEPVLNYNIKGKAKYRIEFIDNTERGVKYDELVNEASKENIREVFENFPVDEDKYEILFEDYGYSTLLINASSTLPLADLEMQNLEYQLGGKEPSDRGYKFNVDIVSSHQELRDVIDRFESDRQIVEHYKILHFSGHYSSRNLNINNKKINIRRLLDPIIKKALLVLDGCNSAKDVSGWTDIGGITTRLINLGALGCITTVLPIKHDPIKGKIFWDGFYSTLRLPAGSIGQSLVTARKKLKDHNEKFDPKNPDWLFYQLIGSPTVKLFESDNS